MRFGIFIKKPRNSSYQKFDETIIGKYCLETSSFTNSWGTQKSNIILEDKSTLLVPSNNIELDNQHNASGTFYIKYLLLFTKSTNLCTTVEIYLKNKFPLILVYNVANLGKLQYCLAPLVE